MSDEPKVIDLRKDSIEDYKRELEDSVEARDDIEFARFMALAGSCGAWKPDSGGFSGRPYREPIGTVFQNEGGKADIPERPETKRDRQRAKKRELKNKK
jgi:hypothetical protein